MKLKAYVALLVVITVTGAVNLPAMVEQTTMVEKARLLIKVASLGSLALYITRCLPEASCSRPGFALGMLATCGAMVAGCLSAGSWQLGSLAFLLGALGLALLFGVPLKMGHAWRIASLALLAALPVIFLEQAIETFLSYSLWVTRFAGYLLYYVGYELTIEGNIITKQQSAVQVADACSGLKMMLMLAALILQFGIVFRPALGAWLKLLLMTMLVGFTVSVLRVDLMVLFLENEKVFRFFYEGTGSELISTAAIALSAFWGRNIIEPKLLAYIAGMQNLVAFSRLQLVCLAVLSGGGILLPSL